MAAPAAAAPEPVAAERSALYAALEAGADPDTALAAWCEALSLHGEGWRWVVLGRGGAIARAAWRVPGPVLRALEGQVAGMGATGWVPLVLTGAGAGWAPRGAMVALVRGAQGEAIGAVAAAGDAPSPRMEALVAEAARVASVALRIEGRPAHPVESSGRYAQRVESLGVLAAGVAHEFNNLLTALTGNLALAQSHTPAASPAAPFLEAASRSVDRAAGVTSAMLAFSGNGHAAVRPTDVREAILGAAPRLTLAVPPGCALRYRLDPDLPAVDLDPVQFQQVLLHLVTNAGEAVGERGGTVMVVAARETLERGHGVDGFSTEELPPGPYVRVEVADDGPGLPPEVLARAFDPFFSTKGPGRGLGLAAVLGIVRGHGAGLRVLSDPRRGARFQVYLPTRPLAPVLAAARPTAPLRGKVLVVDDDPTVRTTTGEMVARLGLDVVHARDGVEAVELHAAHPDVALVLLDLVMPRMDGAQALRALRRAGYAGPVVLCSGYDDDRSPDPIPREELAGVLPKPFERAQLERVVRAAMASRGAVSAG